MIIQSTNKPIILEFTEDVNNSGILNSFRATLWNKKKEQIKMWTKDDVNVIDNLIELPLNQTETATYNDYVYLEIKWLNEDGITEFAETETILIKKQNDKDILGVLND